MKKSAELLLICASLMVGCVEPDAVRSTFHLYDPLTWEPLEGVEVDAGFGASSTNGIGRVSFDHALEGDFTVRARAAGSPDHVFFMEGYGAGFVLDYGAVDRAGVDMITSETQLEWREDMASIEVSGLWLSDLGFLSSMDGARFSIDAEYDGAIYQTYEGWVSGDGQLFEENSLSTVAFVNVPPGEVTVSFELPEGQSASSCAIFPAEDGYVQSKTFTAEAGVISVVMFECRTE